MRFCDLFGSDYIDKFWDFFDHLPPFGDSFWLIKVDIFGLPTKGHSN